MSKRGPIFTIHLERYFLIEIIIHLQFMLLKIQLLIHIIFIINGLSTLVSGLSKSSIFRKIGGVSISAMSPVQVTCLIENNLNEVVTYKPGAESAPGNYSMDILNVAMFRLKIEKTGDGDIGDSAIVSLKVNSAAINYHDAFT